MNRKLIALVFVVLSALLLALAGGAAATSAFFIPDEPNDTFATATPLFQSNSTGGYFLTANDLDYYRFDLPSDNDVYVDARVAGEHGNPPQPVELRLYDASYSLIAENLTCDEDLSLSEPLTAGTYFVLIQRCPGPHYIDNSYGLYVGWPQAVPPWPGDVEPNDTPAQAVPVAYGDDLRGWFSDTDTTDYYKFAGQAGDQIALALTDVSFRDKGTFTLYDPNSDLVTLNVTNVNWPYDLWAELPLTGDYLVKATPSSAYYGDGSIDYDRVLTLTGGDEPNNTMATATDITLGPRLPVTHDYLCDTDWFRFEGRAGDVLAGINTDTAIENVYLYRADGSYLPGHVLPADGIYYLKVSGYYDDKWDSYCNEGVVVYPFAEALWVSPTANKFAGDKTIRQGDIVTRKTTAGQWQIVFDASDVGITKNVNAIEVMPNGSILMSLAAAQNVPGLGEVQPQDIIRFIPTSLGDNTAGTFEWFLDGSDVGLTTSGERIDAIYMQRDIENPLRISTTGSGSVPRTSGGTLKFADEDILNLVGGIFGANSAGTWRMSLDGSTVPGLAKEDISNLARVETYPAHDSTLLTGLDSAFKVNNVSGTPFDVMDGDLWQPVIVGFTPQKIDAMAVGSIWTP